MPGDCHCGGARHQPVICGTTCRFFTPPSCRCPSPPTPISTPSPPRFGQRLQQASLQLVTAESCSGGWIAKCMTDVACSSAFFDCGMVVYSYEAKQRLLGVRAQTLEQFGAVSRETVLEMVSGALVNLVPASRWRSPASPARRWQPGQAGGQRLDRLEAPWRLRPRRVVPVRWRPRSHPPANRGGGVARHRRPAVTCCSGNRPEHA